jgi:transcriptional regulator with XRE-family HTH domain
MIMRYMKPDGLIVNEALRTERKRRGWTQAKVAEALRVSTKTVVRWENGYAAPFPYYRQKLSILFGKTAQELGLLWNADENEMVNTVEQAPL